MTVKVILVKIRKARGKCLSAVAAGYGAFFLRNRLTRVGSLLLGYPFFVGLFYFMEVNNMDMEKLTAQVKKELLRTFIWVVIAMAIATGVYYLVW